MKTRRMPFAIGFIVGITAVAGAATAAETIVSGADEFAWNCADCHGASAKGNGPLAPVLIKQPPDLTALAKRNNGRFPFDDVRKTISGNQEIAGHQSFQMPNYWERFRRDEGRRGFDSADDRITAIAEYLQSIQVE